LVTHWLRTWAILQKPDLQDRVVAVSHQSIPVQDFFSPRQRRILSSFFFFAECIYLALGKDRLCRVPDKIHSAKPPALGKVLVSGSDTSLISTSSCVGL